MTPSGLRPSTVLKATFSSSSSSTSYPKQRERRRRVEHLAGCERSDTNGGSMQSDTQTVPVSKKRLWAGRIISALPALFLLVDGAMKLVKPQVLVRTTVGLGYTESVIVPLGIVLLFCTILYLIPQTGVLGAVLLTGYLGGAVATQVRAG